MESPVTIVPVEPEKSKKFIWVNIMMLFRKKEVDIQKVDAFVSWFIGNHERIRSSVENREDDRTTMLSVLDEVEAQLANLYRDGYKGQIEFDYGGKDGQWNLNLYHKDNRFLMQATELIADKINRMNNSIWSVHTGI